MASWTLNKKNQWKLNKNTQFPAILVQEWISGCLIYISFDICSLLVAAHFNVATSLTPMKDDSLHHVMAFINFLWMSTLFTRASGGECHEDWRRETRCGCSSVYSRCVRNTRTLSKAFIGSTINTACCLTAIAGVTILVLLRSFCVCAQPIGDDVTM